MILSTTEGFDGVNIKDYLGVVFGEVISGVDFTKDFTVSIRNFIGGRAGGYEKELIRAREMALAEMAERAKELGADAVVGTRVDCEPISISNGGVMVMVSASGTAVVLE